jgi:hypothetical protein
MSRLLRYAALAATVALTVSCQPKRTGTRWRTPIENRTDLGLRIGWGDQREGGGTVNVDPHATTISNFLTRATCATLVVAVELGKSRPAGYRPPVKFSPDPWCYDQTLVITDA